MKKNPSSPNNTKYIVLHEAGKSCGYSQNMYKFLIEQVENAKKVWGPVDRPPQK